MLEKTSALLLQEKNKFVSIQQHAHPPLPPFLAPQCLLSPSLLHSKHNCIVPLLLSPITRFCYHREDSPENSV